MRIIPFLNRWWHKYQNHTAKANDFGLFSLGATNPQLFHTAQAQLLILSCYRVVLYIPVST